MPESLRHLQYHKEGYERWIERQLRNISSEVFTRTHQGKVCCGRTPMETLLDGKKVWAEKNLAQI